MDLIQHDIELTHLTTFAIPAKARLYAEYPSERHLEKLSRTEEFINNEVLHIGAGSNLLFVNDFDGLVLHSGIRGMVRYDKSSDCVYAIAGAGEKMDDFIVWAIEQGLGGLENLSGIPGEVGAAAVQNVGAYGVEASDRIFAVECFDTETRKTVRLTREECRFGYRDSLFKHEGKGRYIVLRVSFRLDPEGKPQSLSYGPLREFADKHPEADLQMVREEILRIRNSKLPDPKVLGNAGSFFKNPVISEYYFKEEVLRRRSDVPSYPAGPGMVKVPAGWLIEHAGMKGATIGGAQVYPKQCLVITNTGKATAADVVELSNLVRARVREEFGIALSPEVNFIDTTELITVLGSGTSKGIPEVSCNCHVCTSQDPHDKRRRASVLVSTHGMNILIDVSPDFRSQALDMNLENIDAVLLTHSHYDHVGGMDDLRPFCTFGNMPIYLRKDVNDDLHRRLDYCFRESPYPGVPSFEMHEIDNQPFYINGLKIEPVSVDHGKLPIVGYRIGRFAYITDASHIPEREMEKLENLDTLIINALRYRPHFAHFNVEQALEVIKEVKPERAYLTHICHEMGRHADVAPSLPENVELAYDGLQILIK